MAPPKIVTGARALFQIVDPNTGSARTMGIFHSVSYSVNYDVQPAFILGRETAAELGYTGVEPVSITASAWRVMDHGPHQDAAVPKVQDLLKHEYIELQVIDRETLKPIVKIHSVRPTGHSGNIQAKQLEDMTINFLGIISDDESPRDNAESAGAADLP